MFKENPIKIFDPCFFMILAHLVRLINLLSCFSTVSVPYRDICLCKSIAMYSIANKKRKINDLYTLVFPDSRMLFMG